MGVRILLTVLAGVAPLASAIAAAPLPTARSAPKPDILLIMPDQMRGDCLSILGHPAVRTPSLDALARQGVLFRRAYSPVPSCTPAWHALLTGMSPQASGAVGPALPISTPTLPAVLGAAGYLTVLVGRDMHQHKLSKSCGYQQGPVVSFYTPGDNAYNAFLEKAVPQSGGLIPLVAALGATWNGWQAVPWPLADRLHPTAWVADRSRQAIAEAPLKRPLFLTSSYYAPHPPLIPPKKYFDFYLQQKNLPQPAHGDWVDWTALSPSPKDNQSHRVLLTGEALRHAQAGYFGLIEHLDHEIGPLSKDFTRRSEKAGRPWLIVFTADHGEMLGDHGYFRKCEPYEGSANIPLIIAGSPGLGFRSGSCSLRPVSLEDIMPTLLESAGASLPAAMDGVSLVPVLRGEALPVRRWLHFEHARFYSKDQEFHALTDGRWKYIWRPEKGTERCSIC